MRLIGLVRHLVRPPPDGSEVSQAGRLRPARGIALAVGLGLLFWLVVIWVM